MSDAVRMDRIPLAPQRWAKWVPFALVAAAYYLAAEAAFAIGTLTQTFAPFWPPNVVLLCTLLMVSPRRWAAYILAVFPAHLVAEMGVGMPVPQLLAAFACNVAFATVSAAGLRYFIGVPPWLGSLRNVTTYLLVSVLLAPGAVSLVTKAPSCGPSFHAGDR